MSWLGAWCRGTGTVNAAALLVRHLTLASCTGCDAGLVDSLEYPFEMSDLWRT
jgi:hypothetical protein